MAQSNPIHPLPQSRSRPVFDVPVPNRDMWLDFKPEDRYKYIIRVYISRLVFEMLWPLRPTFFKSTKDLYDLELIKLIFFEYLKDKFPVHLIDPNSREASLCLLRYPLLMTLCDAESASWLEIMENFKRHLVPGVVIQRV